MINYLSILLILFGFLFPAESWSKEFKTFRHLTTEDGLPSNTVYLSLQDSLGYMWLATEMGLCRFDGQTFKYYYSPILEDIEIINLMIIDNKIFFINNSFKIFYIENEEVKQFNPEGLLEDIIALHLEKLAPKIYRISRKQKPDDVILNLREKTLTDEEGQHYGEYRISFISENRYIFLGDPSTNSILDSVYVSGNLWKQALGILRVIYNSKNVSLETFKALFKDLKTLGILKKNTFLSRDHYDNYWLSDEKRNLFVVDKDGKFIKHFEEYDNIQINGVAVDKDNNIWLSTNRGVFIISDQVPIGRQILKGNIILDIIPYNDDLFLKREYSTGSILKTDGNILSKHYPISKDYQHAISWGDNLLLVAHHLILINNEKIKIIKRHCTKYILKEREYFWEANCYGIFQLDSSFKTIRTLRAESIRIYSMVLLPGTNIIFLGTTKGLYLFDKQKWTIKPYVGKYGTQIRTSIADMKIDRKGALWLALKGGGVKSIKDGVIRTYRNSNESFENICLDLTLDDEDNVWVATKNGIKKISPEGEIVMFNQNDGFISSECNSIHFDNGLLYLGTNSGLNIIETKKLVQPQIIETPVIEEIQVNDKLIDTNTRTGFSYKENNLLFKVVSIAFDKQIKYQYSLDKGKTWKNILGNQLILNDLKDGFYAIQFRAHDIYQNYSESSNAYQFRIHPPWWQTTWFSILVVSGIILMFYGFFRWSTKRQILREREKNKMLLKLSELEAQAIRSQMNPHFIFNALNSIQSFIFKNEPAKANEYLSDFSKLIRRFLDSSKNPFLPLRTVIEMLDLYIGLEQMRADNKFIYKIGIDENLEEHTEVPFMIVQPFVENAILHGLLNKETKGELLIHFDKTKKERLEIRIEDDGIGIEEAQRRKQQNKFSTHESKGMQIVKENVKILEKTRKIKIDIHQSNNNNKGTGTIVVVRMPIMG